MDINIHIDADERLCRALDNFANTLLSLVIVTEEKRQAEEAKAEETKAVETKTVETKTEETKTEETALAAIDYKALRAELKSVMAKAAKEGKAEAVKALLAELGVSKLSQIPDDALEEALRKAGDI